MGNTLCKGRVNHSNTNSKSPVDRVIDRCAQICPKSIGKQKHFWDKQVLETQPPQQTQPQSDTSGWHSESLTVPDSPKTANGDHPVAPPRKKRPSLVRKDDAPVRNGFKEIFAGQRSESTTTSDSQGDLKDFTDFEKMPLNRGSEKEKQLKVQQDEIATPARSSEIRSEVSETSEAKSCSLAHKVPKVGNKKSDKFFGENLSDCLSDEPIAQGDDEIVSEIKEAMLKPDAKKNDEFDDREEAIKDELLASLTIFKDIKQEEGTDEPDRVAIEEPMISKKIVTRHICDDEDALRPHIHFEHESAYVVPDPNAPKKPQRDFTKYKKTHEDLKAVKVTATESSSMEPEPQLDLLSQIQNELPALKDILSPKEKRVSTKEDEKRKSVEDVFMKVVLEEKPDAVKEKIKIPSLQMDSELLPAKMSESETNLRRQLSSETYLSADLVEQIAQEAKMTDAYYLEEYSSYNDGSGLSPNSKLVQKRSVSTPPIQADGEKQYNQSKALAVQLIKVDFPASTEPTVLSQEDEREEEEPETPPVHTKLTKPPVFTINNEVIARSDANVKPAVAETEKRKEITPRRKISHELKIKSTNQDISNAIKSFLEKDDLKPEDVLLILEEEFGELLNSKSLPAEDRKIIEDLRNTVDLKLDELESVEHKNEAEKPLTESLAEESRAVISQEISEITEKAKTIVESATESKAEENPKMARTPVSKIPVPVSVSKVMSEEKRRHSIDEFDHWFAGGLSRKIDVPERKRKRESSLPGYLSTKSISEDAELPAEIEDAVKSSEDAVEAESESKYIDKSGNETPKSIITTTTIYRFDPIPEGVVHSTVHSTVHSASVTATPVTKHESSHVEPIIEAKTTAGNASPSKSAQAQSEPKRHSVGHSVLLKFLDIERNNSFQ